MAMKFTDKPAHLYCPHCNTVNDDKKKGPVLVHLNSDYHPWVRKHGPDGGYGDELEHPQYRYECPRCKYAEIWIEQPRERES